MRSNIIKSYSRHAYLWLRRSLQATTVAAFALLAGHTQADQEKFDIWVMDAPLSLVVEQLASMTGTVVDDPDVLSDKVSGTYTGTLHEILSAIAQGHDLLFDLQDSVLFVTSKDDASKLTLAVPESGLDQTILEQWQRQLAPGNSFIIDNGEIAITGHPEFVKRLSNTITSGDADAPIELVVSDGISRLTLQAEAEVDPASLASMEIDDAGARAMLQDRQADITAASRAARTDVPASTVTDIPGFSTF